MFGETFMWFFAIAAAWYAATMSLRVFLTMTAAGIAASVLAKAVLQRWRSPQH